MKFRPVIFTGVDCAWYNFHVDIIRFDVVHDVFRRRNLHDYNKEQAILVMYEVEVP